MEVGPGPVSWLIVPPKDVGTGPNEQLEKGLTEEHDYMSKNTLA